MYPPPLVSHRFRPPTLETAEFRLEPLTRTYLQIDFDAIMATGVHLDGTMVPPGWLGDVDRFTLDDDELELAWHEREFRRGSSYAYIAVSPEGTSLGCAYVNPSDRATHDAVITSWGRFDPERPGWDSTFFEIIEEWVTTSWPFANPAFPGRRIDWNDWLVPSTE
jgi:hypothetical protein